MVIDLSWLAPGSEGSERQRSTAASKSAPVRRMRPTGDVLEGGLVGRDQPGSGATLDGHVADGHALLHGQRPDAVAGVLEDVAGAAADADAADAG